MKTATITWITYNNYGTLLQAYALQTYLRQEGISNDIISDSNIIKLPIRNLKQDIQSSESPASSADKCRLGKNMKRIKKYALHPVDFVKALHSLALDKREILEQQRFLDAQKMLEAFKNNRLNIVYGLQREDMASLNQRYDAFLCGSDQIWSVLDQNFDGYYYLNFAKKKKISYAASIGTDQIDQPHCAQIKAWLNDFSAISVREIQTAKQLSELTRRNVKWVADPTLLHEKAFWTEFSTDAICPQENYLLCYFLSDKPWYFEYASAVAKYLKLKIIMIPTNAKQMRRKECYQNTVDPTGFVSLIHHAQFVLTDSYHGSIFSILFEKNFLYLKRFNDSDQNCQNIRILSLFERVGLLNRIVEGKKFSPDDLKPINYRAIDDILRVFREQSREFLRDALLSV